MTVFTNRQEIYVWRNNETCSCNQFCGGTAIGTTYCECVCSLRYSACNAHAPYCHLWPVQFYNVFSPHIISQIARFSKKKIIEHKMCVLIFSTTFVWNISHSKKNSARYDTKCILVLMQSKRSCSTVNETSIFWADFRKIFKYPTSLTVQLEPRCSTRTDGQTWGN